MVFSSLFFIFAFLVLCYGVYLFAPTAKARNTVLLVFSLIFYAWGGPPLVLLLCLETLVCYLGALLIHTGSPSPHRPADQAFRRFALAVTVGICLGLLVLYKYTGFFTDTFCGLFGLENLIPKVALPIGISF